MSEVDNEATGEASMHPNTSSSSSSPDQRRDPRKQDSDPSSSHSSKRAGRRTDVNAAKRGRRMFDILNSTLTKAKEDNVRRSSGEAGRKRAEIEARLQKKLKDEPLRQRKLEELSKRLKPLINHLLELHCEIESKESSIRLRKSQKRRLASFLITQSELTTFDGKIAKKTSPDNRVLATDIALVLAPIGPDHPRSVIRPDSHPIYFLPNKNFPIQEDRLDEQEDRVDEEIDQADNAWREEKGEIQREIKRVKDEILVIKADMERLEKGDNDEQVDMEMKEVDTPSEKNADVEKAGKDDIDENMNDTA